MICALCKKDSILRNSHIVPEFLYKSVYDDQHGTYCVKHGEKRKKLLRKGLREYLLCDGCEHKIQLFEDYYKNHWVNQNPIKEPISEKQVNITGIDYKNLKIFLLSIIWRASVAKSDTFKSAYLGPHEEIIRKMILSKHPSSDNNYIIFAGTIIDPKTRLLWDKIIL